MKIGIAADHAGFELKGLLIRRLEECGHQIQDFGAASYQADDDYPDCVIPLARSVTDSGTSRGVAICGSGIGACMTANKVAGVRASVCHDTWSARQGVEHDDMNLLVLGARVVGVELAWELLKTFLSAEFTGEERHLRRLRKIAALEDR